jgi:hypothetical protein
MVGSSMPENYGESGPYSTPDSPWMSSTSSSLSGPGMTGFGVELLSLPVDSLVQTYTGHYAATGSSAHG